MDTFASPNLTNFRKKYSKTNASLHVLNAEVESVSWWDIMSCSFCMLCYVSCLILFYLIHTKTVTLKLLYLSVTDVLKTICQLWSCLVHWDQSGFMITVNHFRDTCVLFTTIFTLDLWSKICERTFNHSALLYGQKQKPLACVRWRPPGLAVLFFPWILWPGMHKQF